jgi:hypothetical protein
MNWLQPACSCANSTVALTMAHTVHALSTAFVVDTSHCGVGALRVVQASRRSIAPRHGNHARATRGVAASMHSGQPRSSTGASGTCIMSRAHRAHTHTVHTRICTVLRALGAHTDGLCTVCACVLHCVCCCTGCASALGALSVLR